MANERKSGILQHPSSFPGHWSIGDLGDEVDHFLAWLEQAGQSLWQILPLGPTGVGNSPYGALSSFAGNPLLISPVRLYREGLLAMKELPDITPQASRVDFARAQTEKESLLRQAWSHVQRIGGALRDELDEFVESDSARSWLDGWVLYRALKDRFHGRPWVEWDTDVAFREPAALDRARRELRDEIGFHAFVQWIFHRQWTAIRAAAAARGITIIGDLPIYVAWDSADCWANPGLFHLDSEGCPTVVAGVPPDYFSKTGQRWGNPLYRWDEMQTDGYRWWLERIRACLTLADVVRLDHFRGFASYWEVPAKEETAVRGRWVKGPGLALFNALRDELGQLPLLAEDLGVITEDVTELMRATGLPGMRVLQFAFKEIDSSHAPHNHLPDSVVYTGTHDNDTTCGWFASASDQEQIRALSYLGGTKATIHESMIRAAETSVARWAIVPVQDVFGLGSEARMNVPGLPDGNWSWRATPGLFDDESADSLRRLTSLGGRCVA